MKLKRFILRVARFCALLYACDLTLQSSDMDSFLRSAVWGIMYIFLSQPCTGIVEMRCIIYLPTPNDVSLQCTKPSRGKYSIWQLGKNNFT
jgi:hypothetical protein